jgi:hypothetical protein
MLMGAGFALPLNLVFSAALGNAEIATSYLKHRFTHNSIFAKCRLSSARRSVMQNRIPKLVKKYVPVAALALAAITPAAAQAQPAGNAAPSLPKVGDMAPNFTLKYFDGTGLKDVSLSQYRGKKNVVVAFFIFAFTGG